MNSKQSLSVAIVTILGMAASLAFAAAPPGIGGTPKDVAFYIGGAGEQKLECVFTLSDGTLLLGGGASDLDWVPQGVPVKLLGGPLPQGESTGMIPFLLHCSADLQTILAVVQLPKDCAQDIRRIETSSVPGTPTGPLYISGTRKGSWNAKPRGGYFIARLDHNFLDGTPTRCEWLTDIGAAGKLEKDQPWDVGGDGKVVYATGNPYSYDWMAVERLKADGTPDVVPEWRTHWYTKADGSTGEHWGASSDAPGPIQKSAIVLKIWDRGDFRSWTQADYELKTSDGNGGIKQGRWPFDAMFDGYFNPETKKTEKVTDTGKGYYGYRWGTTPSASIGAIAIDRRTNEMYLGGNNKSKLPDGLPDFEPWVVAMSHDGALRWWQRLYAESRGVSTPDQYIDNLVIDYSKPRESGGKLVVVARSHGNNVNNFYNASGLVNPDSPKKGFQDGFTGTNGNMHYSWLGKLSLEKGDVINCSYLAEYAEGAKHQNQGFTDANIRHWPHWRAGWPDLNTTKVKDGSVSVDADGNVTLCAVGRRAITTRGAFMEVPSPTEHSGSKGQWTDFVRAYNADLTGLNYSSILMGPWDWTTGAGGSGVDFSDCVTVPGGVVVVGTSAVSKQGLAEGSDMPTRNCPSWGKTGREGKMGVAAILHF